MLQNIGAEDFRRLASQNGEAEKLAGAEDLTHQTDAGERQGKAQAHSNAVK